MYNGDYPSGKLLDRYIDTYDVSVLFFPIRRHNTLYETIIDRVTHIRIFRVAGTDCPVHVTVTVFLAALLLSASIGILSFRHDWNFIYFINSTIQFIIS